MDVKSNFLQGKFQEGFAIWIEYDEVNKRAIIYQKFRYDFFHPKKYGNKNGSADYERAIRKVIQSKIKDAKSLEELFAKKEGSLPADLANLPSDGQYRSDDMMFWQWALFTGHELGYIVNEGQTNTRLWNDHKDPEAYKKSPMNTFAPLNGGADEGLEVVQDVIQLVEFTGECIKDPGVIKNIYEKVKNLKYDDLKHLVKESINEKVDEYNNQGNRVRQYRLTRDGIDVVKFAIAAPLLIKSSVKNVKGLFSKGGDLLKKMEKFMAEIADEGIKVKIGNLSKASRERFMDFVDKVDDRVRNIFKTNSKGVDAWNNFDAGNFDEMDNLLESAEDALTAEQKLLREAYEELDEFSASNWPQDAVYRQKKINGPRPTLAWKNRRVGKSIVQNKAIDDFCTELSKLPGIDDIRINQTQTNALKQTLGINRPDVQFTYAGKRYYMELDGISSPRSIPHKQRIRTNDAAATLTQDALPAALRTISITVNGKAYYLKGSITLWDDID